MVKTHLIITDIHEEYHIKWCGSIANTNPVIENGMPIFIIRGREGAVEVNSVDIKYIESIAKKMTAPRGREAVTTDTVSIAIKEIDGNEKIIGLLTHDHIKHYAPMYDKIGYKIYD